MAVGAIPSTIGKMIVSRGASLAGIGRQSGSLPFKFAQMKELGSQSLFFGTSVSMFFRISHSPASN
jgi:hypothetical protein